MAVYVLFALFPLKEAQYCLNTAITPKTTGGVILWRPFEHCGRMQGALKRHCECKLRFL
jgi:hypothetical protein